MDFNVTTSSSVSEQVKNSPITPQFVDLVTLKSISSAASISPVRPEPQPSLRSKKDVPDLNWVVGSIGKRREERSEKNDSKSDLASRFINQRSTSMQTLSPYSSSSQSPSSSSKPTKLVMSPTRYHFVPSTLSPNQRQSVIMRHVATPPTQSQSTDY